MMAKPAFRSQRGNALMEYAVPAAIIVVSAGVLITIFDIQEIGADYFLAASGGTRADLSGSSYEYQSGNALMGGSAGTGAGGFSGTMGRITPVGGGGAVPRMTRAQLEAAYPPGMPASIQTLNATVAALATYDQPVP